MTLAVLVQVVREAAGLHDIDHLAVEHVDDIDWNGSEHDWTKESFVHLRGKGLDLTANELRQDEFYWRVSETRLLFACSLTRSDGKDSFVAIFDFFAVEIANILLNGNFSSDNVLVRTLEFTEMINSERIAVCGRVGTEENKSMAAGVVARTVRICAGHMMPFVGVTASG